MLLVTLLRVLALGILISSMQKGIIKDGYAVLQRIADEPGHKPRPIGEEDERFYRRDSARTDSGSYGLGLPIAEGIVEKHGRKIRCDWENGEICFTITIPTL